MKYNSAPDLCTLLKTTSSSRNVTIVSPASLIERERVGGEVQGVINPISYTDVISPRSSCKSRTVPSHLLRATWKTEWGTLCRTLLCFSSPSMCLYICTSSRSWSMWSIQPSSIHWSNTECVNVWMCQWKIEREREKEREREVMEGEGTRPGAAHLPTPRLRHPS